MLWLFRAFPVVCHIVSTLLLTACRHFLRKCVAAFLRKISPFWWNFRRVQAIISPLSCGKFRRISAKISRLLAKMTAPLGCVKCQLFGHYCFNPEGFWLNICEICFDCSTLFYVFLLALFSFVGLPPLSPPLEKERKAAGFSRIYLQRRLYVCFVLMVILTSCSTPRKASSPPFVQFWYTFQGWFAKNVICWWLLCMGFNRFFTNHSRPSFGKG